MTRHYMKSSLKAVLFLILTFLLVVSPLLNETIVLANSNTETKTNLADSTLITATSSELTETSTDSTFTWDNATVYFVLTDRFLDGDSSNNHAYGRELDRNGNPYPNYKNKVASYHGGDLKGLTQKLNEGYFTSLGVNAIWITQPFEQINGWIGGEGFRHYPFHGYYAQDFTELDKSLGTKDDLQTFIDTAHEQGIRIVFDVVMNHAGYESMKDMQDHGFGQLNNGWENYYYSQNETEAHYDTYGNYINTNSHDRWQNWWGSDWIRKSGLPGYDACGNDDRTMCLAGLPDFKTESTKHVAVPQFLKNKWGAEKTQQEQAELQQFFNESGKSPTVRNHLIKWLTDWVRDYGVDGFRIDTAKHVEIDAWKELKIEANKALHEWKANNPDKKLDDENFWMTGEVWGHGVGKSEYFSNGFDSVINFDFQKQLQSNLSNLESLYSDYANKINSDPNFNVLSYLSSHDTTLYDRNNMINGGTGLLLAPGAVQIFYGDEVARAWMDAPWSDMRLRSSMDWNNVNQTVLAHWQKVGQFRNNHLSIGAGQHKQLQASPYAFSRTYNKDGVEDKVVVAVGANGKTTINVSSVFADGTLVRDFYTGETATVSGGSVTFTAHQNGVILIELAELEKPVASVSASPEGSNFRTETVDVTLKLANAEEGKYTLDGSDPKVNGITFVNGDVVTIGESLAIGESVTLKLFAENEHGTATKSYTYTKVDPNSGLTIHYKKPDGWNAPQIYYYNTSPAVEEPTWATAPAMESEGNGWYSYTIDGADSSRIIFKDSSGKQSPAQGEAGFLRSSEGWYMDGKWYDENPEKEDTEAPSIPTGLKVTATTDSTVSLAWNASTDNQSGVAHYEVLKGEEKIGTATSTNYQVNNLTANTSYEFAVVAVDKNGNKSKATESVQAKTKEKGVGNTATIYYKKGFATPNFHYAPNGADWTKAPGVGMEDSAQYPGYAKITIDLGAATSLQGVFNNGAGVWDNNGGKNYQFQAGVSTFANGKVTQGEPKPDKVTFNVTVPTQTLTTDKIYMTSTLNGWKPDDSDYELKKNANGSYSISLQVPANTQIEYKFTLGSWATVEKDQWGNDISNRTFKTNGGEEVVDVTVQKWNGR
ncbi:carbohydrate binding domain-containing protein [Metabacillus malikii]|uniref:Alpha-amylase n=1 Tax=Metabacillus malikii TaxID=1504265 RepID=A0ABT9ZJ02_9BACI|nr:alpha-amylase family glycosyl hydrolase [Metabacillus malikii]MDQ0232256.1 alpha-amylase [Metabacillus malikii]